MGDELDVIIECEDSNSDFEGILYLKATSWRYMLKRTIKLYDLGLIKIFLEALGLEQAVPPLATDFGKSVETFDIKFIIKEHDVATAEARLNDAMGFIRNKTPFADQCFLYIGTNIDYDGTRMLDVAGKGIEGKVATFDVDSKTKENYISGNLKFIVAIDLLNW